MALPLPDVTPAEASGDSVPDDGVPLRDRGHE
jgi:hypothetical protein